MAELTVPPGVFRVLVRARARHSNALPSLATPGQFVSQSLWRVTNVSFSVFSTADHISLFSLP
jgi:hypothetical protein